MLHDLAPNENDKKKEILQFDFSWSLRKGPATDWGLINVILFRRSDLKDFFRYVFELPPPFSQ